MSKVIRYLPELRDDEQIQVATLFHEMSEEQAEQFARVYRQRRKDANITMIMALVCLVGFAGIHRFYLGHVGMGILYLLTWGLCGVGTVVDLLKYRELTYRYNEGQALDVAMLVKGAFPAPPKELGPAE